MLNIVIMCGGSGTRLWPLSREKLPKQFLKLTDEKYTMFQLTCLRVKDLVYDSLFVICNIEHMFLAEQQLNELGITNYKLVGEPFGKNTCAAITTSCILSSPDSELLVMSSDHMWNDEVFTNSVKDGLKMVDQGIIVFGIKPLYPETGYGYLNYDNNKLIKFIEKPCIDDANKYFESGNYLWNSGNFLFSNKIMTNELQTYAKDIYDSVLLTIQNSGDTTKSQIVLNKEFFKVVRDESIDYAVMEFHNNGKVVVYDGYWNDIGSFKSLYDHLKKDENGNIVNGDIRYIDTHNSLIQSETKLVTTLGINNMVIIDTRDTLFIANKDRSQDVKLFVKDLKKDNRSETIIHAKAYRPWGWYICIDGDDNSGSKVKRIGVYPGKRLSLQSHNRRAEHWVIVKGTAKVQVGKDFHILNPNQSVYIPTGALHRMENVGTELVEFIETQIGDYLGEDDIIRYEDDFGRI
jgi:mannose-1-phosphate guanylyltransferase/mannose-6-phosphate isomerase